MHQQISKILISNVPFLAALEPTQLQAVVASAHRRSYGRGRFILRAGVKEDRVYILIGGRAYSPGGRRSGREMVLSEIEPNELFGELLRSRGTALSGGAGGGRLRGDLLPALGVRRMRDEQTQCDNSSCEIVSSTSAKDGSVRYGVGLR